VSDSQLQQSGTQLFKVLTFFDLMVYGLVYVSPVGPWGTWAFASDLAGGAVALAFLIGVVALLFTAFSYATMAMEVPDAGSVYTYAKVSMGEAVGFLAGWMVLLDYILLPALMYVFCGAALGAFIPVVPAWAWILTVATYNIAVNWFGIKNSARFNFGTLIVQFVLLFAVLLPTVYVLVKHHSPILSVTPWWNANATPQGLFSAATLCVLAYTGFDAITTLASEVRPEQRHLIGRSVVATLVFLGVLGIFNVWLLSDLSVGLKFKDPTVGTFDAVSHRIDPTLGTITAWAAAIVTAISITPPMVTAVARVLYAMAKNHEMPHALARIHSRYGIPHVALLVSGGISIAIALYFAGAFDTLTAMVNFGAMVAFIAVNASVIVLFAVRRRSKRWISHVVSPILGIGMLIAVLTQMRMVGLIVGFGWMAAGIVVCLVLRRRRVAGLPRPPVSVAASSTRS
jgi:amino acid transporter